jgi:hypothetical protein
MRHVGCSAGIPSSINNTSIIEVSAEETIGGCYNPDDPAVLVDHQDIGAAYGDFEAEPRGRISSVAPLAIQVSSLKKTGLSGQ